MKLVIGGAFQGKLEFAQKTYHLEDSWIDGRNCDFSEITECLGIHHFHDYIRRMMEAQELFCANDLTRIEQQAENFAEWLSVNNPNLVIVTNELGYGIVPIKERDRLWREMTGRVCTGIASRADEVVRVVCGIGTRLK